VALLAVALVGCQLIGGFGDITQGDAGAEASRDSGHHTGPPRPEASTGGDTGGGTGVGTGSGSGSQFGTGTGSGSGSAPGTGTGTGTGTGHGTGTGSDAGTSHDAAGTIPCGSTSCAVPSLACCTGGVPASCAPEAECLGSNIQTCLGKADCPAGNICCVDVISSASIITVCQTGTTCPINGGTSASQGCRSTTECVTGTCSQYDCMGQGLILSACENPGGCD